MYYLEFKLPLLNNVTIELVDKRLAAFAKRQLLNYFIAGAKNSRHDNVKSRITFNEQFIYNTFNVYHKEGLALARHGVWENNRITLNGYCYELSNNNLVLLCQSESNLKNRVKSLYRAAKANSEEKRYALLGGDFYKMILFPIFSVYAACYGLYCIHGSLIRLSNGNNIIISGLDGVGKSTLSSLLCEDAKNKLLADNIVLFDGMNALNFNLAMRLEVKEKTKMKCIYSNKEIQEILPKDIGFGLCPINQIYTLLRDFCNENMKTYDKKIAYPNWLIFLERAPEIGQANQVLSYWLYMYSLINSGNEGVVPIISIAIPNGKVDLAKEIIQK